MRVALAVQPEILRIALRWTATAARCAVLCGLLAGCASWSAPAAPAMPSPFPTFDLARLPPPPAGALPLEVRTYLAEVAAYTDPAVIAVAPQFTAERLDEIAARLEAVYAPAELAAAHQALLKGYRSIAAGRRVAAGNIGDNQLQAEARSLTDFGAARLQEHLQLVDAYLTSLRATPAP